MKHTVRQLSLLCILLLIVAISLAACGEDDQEGVVLQPVDQGPDPSATALPVTPDEPAAMSASETDLGSLSGRLLYRRGLTLEVRDLATCDTRVIGEDVTVNSVFLLDDAQTRGVFVDYPNFGVFDIASGDVTPIPNTGSNPNLFDISPDGRWLVATTGTLIARLQITDLETLETQMVASGSSVSFQWAFTTESDLIWWDVTEGTPQRYDPATNSSTPLEELFTVARMPGAAVSPDRTHLAIIPVAPGRRFDGAPVAGDPDVCIESVVQNAPNPLTIADESLASQIEVLWSEPGLVASSPVWQDDDTLFFVRLGTGACGQVEGEEERSVMQLDLDGSAPQVVIPRLGNATDPSDFAQSAARQFDHLFSLSPDGRFIAWIDGEREDRETLIKITELDTGNTQTVIRLTEADAASLADFIEEATLRQVVWLD